MPKYVPIEAISLSYWDDDLTLTIKRKDTLKRHQSVTPSSLERLTRCIRQDPSISTLPFGRGWVASRQPHSIPIVKDVKNKGGNYGG